MTASREILITGAGGFVGSALVEGFLALGWRVTAVDRAFDAATRARLAGSHLITVDLSHGDSSDLPAAAVVVHAAAVTTGAATLGWTPAAHIAANIGRCWPCWSMPAALDPTPSSSSARAESSRPAMALMALMVATVCATRTCPRAVRRMPWPSGLENS